MLQSVDKESCLEVVHTALREGGVLATLWTGEGLVQACPQGQMVDTLLAVVMAARKHLGLLVVLVTDGTRDFIFQILQAKIFLLSHL